LKPFKKGDVLLPLLLNLTLGSVVRKLQENQEEMELIGTHQALVYADDNVVSENRNTIKNKSGTQGSCQAINAETSINSCTIFHNQNTGQNHKSCDLVKNFKCLGITVTSQNYIYDKIKMRLNFRKACYFSLQNLLSHHVLNKKLKYLRL
jgi:HJR/Mrr/RecB family endonuclease